MSAHDLVEVTDLGWQATGFSSPSVYRVDGRCSCGYIGTTTAPAGEEVARRAMEALHRRHVDLADLEDRIVRAFGGLDLLPGSVLRLTERAARRLARLAIEEFVRPPLSVTMVEEEGTGRHFPIGIEETPPPDSPRQ